IRLNHIYGNISCTRYACITSTKTFRIPERGACAFWTTAPRSKPPNPHKKAPAHNWTGATPARSHICSTKSLRRARFRRAVAEHPHEVLDHRRVQEHEFEYAHDAFDALGFLDQPVQPLELELDPDFRCALGFAAQYVEAAADAHEHAF